MDLMNASKYMSSAWLAKAPSLMQSQPSQSIMIPQSVKQSEAIDSSYRINKPERASPIEDRPLEPKVETNDVSEERQAAQQQLAFEQVIAQLRARDQEVRTHEQAHLSAAGPYATGGIKYDYQTGPDGQKYAVGGSVGIDTSPVSGDLEATIQKMMVVQRAALAPAQPSAQDFKVAAQASQLQAQARSELQAERADELKTSEETNDRSAPSSLNENQALPAQAGSIDPRNQTNQNTDSLGQVLERNNFDLRMRLQINAA